MDDPLSFSQTGFLILSKRVGEPFYVSCKDGIIELIVKEANPGNYKIALRSTNQDIRFHRDLERLRRDLGTWVRYYEEGNGSGAV